MNRPHALERLLFSVAAHRPDAMVHVADQGETFDRARYDDLVSRLLEAGLRNAPAIHRLPFDCGISAARNHLVESTTSEYKLCLDDDFLFTGDTDIDAFVRILDAHPDAGVVGGAVTRNGRVRHTSSRLKRSGGFLEQMEISGPFENRCGVRLEQTDFVPLFALMRESLFDHLRWDEDLKTAGAHLDFFLSMRDTPLTALYTPDVTIDHPPIDADPTYAQLRHRVEFRKLLMKKHGLTHLKTPNQTVLELLPDGELIAYCELRGSSPII
jgi:hypothetical protein